MREQSEPMSRTEGETGAGGSMVGGPSAAAMTSMTNIGREMARKLASVGIDTPEKLREAGSKEAFLRLKQVYPQVCLVHLYALEGAIHSVGYDRLSEETKKGLKEFSDFLKR